ncbi:unnamed protein product, partial [Ectocarpus fasciculatus]
KKSRFQKAREEAEEKKRLEELETSKIYESFVASFESDGGSQSFVRGGSGDSRRGGRPGDVYKLEAREPESSAAPNRPGGSGAAGGKPLKEMDRMLLDFKVHPPSTWDWLEREDERVSRGSVPPSRRGGFDAPAKELVMSAGGLRAKPKGEIDSFLNEIMNTDSSQAAAASVHAPGSHDSGDGSTTNLYVGNLAPSVTEEQLTEIFGAFGPVNSVKVMWPRTPEERSKQRNCGFVSFMTRVDAEDAKNELHDYVLDGHHITVGWGKAVKINAVPVPMPSRAAALPVGPPPAVSRGPAPPLCPPPGMHSLTPFLPPPLPPGPPPAALAAPLPPGPPPPPSRWDSRPPTENDAKIVVIVPQDRAVRELIDLTAKFVAIDGDPFEQAVKERQRLDPRYAFLFNPGSHEGTYYRWRTYANVMGDDERSWRDEPFVMFAEPGAPFWIPP